eukprot:9801230-Ditylum_brightwellii.AAC.1
MKGQITLLMHVIPIQNIGRNGCSSWVLSIVISATVPAPATQINKISVHDPHFSAENQALLIQ